MRDNGSFASSREAKKLSLLDNIFSWLHRKDGFTSLRVYAWLLFCFTWLQKLEGYLHDWQTLPSNYLDILDINVMIFDDDT